MVRIGYRAHDFGSFDSASALGERIGSFRKPSLIQLALNKVIPSARPWQEWDEEYISSIAADLAAHGVQIAIIGCYINPIHPEPEQRKKEIERFVRSLSLASAFGCPYVGTETGTANPNGGYSLDTSDPRNMDIFLDSLSQMLEAAEKYNAYVAIEGVARSHSISSPARMEKVISRFPTDRLKIIFDPVNLIPFMGIPESDGVSLRIPSAEAQKRFAAELLDIYSGRLVAIHCKDYVLNPENGTKIGDLPALTGIFDWKSFAGELHSRSIDVPWLLENFNPETAEETTQTLEKF